MPSVFASRSDLLRPTDGAVSSSVIHPVGGCLSRVGEALPINRLCMSSLHIWGMLGMEGVPKKPRVYRYVLYYSLVLAADDFNNWINIPTANDSRFDSAAYHSVVDKLCSMKITLFQVSFQGVVRRKSSLPFAEVRDPSASGPNDMCSDII